MKQPFFYRKKIRVGDDKELHSRKFWTYFLTIFVLLLTAEMIFFSVYFMRVSRVLDEPATPTLETNAAQIRHMNENLDATESAIQTRTKAR